MKFSEGVPLQNYFLVFSSLYFLQYVFLTVCETSYCVIAMCMIHTTLLVS